MSWTVTMVGKPKALIGLLPAEFDRTTCAEPEQTIKASVKEIVLLFLAAYPDDAAVKVSASGSQAKEYRKGFDQSKVVNSLSITIESLWGFQE